MEVEEGVRGGPLMALQGLHMALIPTRFTLHSMLSPFTGEQLQPDSHHQHAGPLKIIGVQLGGGGHPCGRSQGVTADV